MGRSCFRPRMYGATFGPLAHRERLGVTNLLRRGKSHPPLSRKEGVEPVQLLHEEPLRRLEGIGVIRRLHLQAVGFPLQFVSQTSPPDLP